VLHNTAVFRCKTANCWDGRSLASASAALQSPFAWPAYARGRADAVVTFNKRDFAMVAERFGVRVFSPGEAGTLLETRP
jgi:hypothetical protein